MGKRFVDMAVILRRMQAKDDRINAELRQRRETFEEMDARLEREMRDEHEDEDEARS